MFKFIKDFLIGCIILIIFLILILIGKKFSSNLCALVFMKIGPFSKFNKIAKKIFHTCGQIKIKVTLKIF